MVKEKFIWCRNCGDIHHVTAYDRAPAYEFCAGEAAETPANDWRDFMARHAGHKLEPLVGTGNDFWPNGAAADPMAVAFIEASNGKETVLLRRSRRAIREAIRYELVSGRLIERSPRLEVQEQEIRKEMKLHHSWAPAAPLAEDKIELFIGLFRDIVDHLDPQQVREREYSSRDVNLAYSGLSDTVVTALLGKCTDYFSAPEVESLRRFIEGHREPGDVLALVKRRCVTLDQHAQ